MDKIEYIILLALFIMSGFLGAMANMPLVIIVSSVWAGYYLYKILHGEE